MRPDETGVACGVGPANVGAGPRLEGFVSNEEILRLSNVRLRVDVVDVVRVATEEAFGWVFGDLAPAGEDTSSCLSRDAERTTE